MSLFFVVQALTDSNGSNVSAPLRSSQGERPLDVLRRLVLLATRDYM